MDLPKGFHREVIEARENDSVDFTETSLKKRVDSSPLKTGGANFKTHALVEQSSSKLYYRPSIGGVLFCIIFSAIGIGVIIFNLGLNGGLNFNPSSINLFAFLFGLVFASFGGYMFYYFFKPRVFDKQLGYYYKGYNYKPRDKQLKHQLKLNTIVAVQIIGETINGNDGSYGSFELNLVLEDGTRRNVVDHGNLKSIIDDAYIISAFLNIPIWHAKSKTE